MPVPFSYTRLPDLSRHGIEGDFVFRPAGSAFITPIIFTQWFSRPKVVHLIV